jgi:hypothetical protein
MACNTGVNVENINGGLNESKQNWRIGVMA